MRRQRFHISLPPYIADLLRNRADFEGRSAADLASFYVERDIREQLVDGADPEEPIHAAS
jgi:hypothetical protein